MADSAKVCGAVVASEQTKISVYCATVMTTLLHGSETWTVYCRHETDLNHFLTIHLRKLLGITWQDKIPDTEVLACVGLPSIHTLLKKISAPLGRTLGPVCHTTAYPRNSCWVSSGVVNAYLVGPKSATKTH